MLRFQDLKYNIKCKIAMSEVVRKSLVERFPKWRPQMPDVCGNFNPDVDFILWNQVSSKSLIKTIEMATRLKSKMAALVLTINLTWITCILFQTSR